MGHYCEVENINATDTAQFYQICYEYIKAGHYLSELNILIAENFDEGEWDYFNPKGVADDIIRFFMQIILTKSKSGTDLERWVPETNTQDPKNGVK